MIEGTVIPANQIAAVKIAVPHEFERAKTLGLISTFVHAGVEFNIPASLLMAIASRETEFNPYFISHPGDEGHGHGLMQIDNRSYPEFCSSEGWKDPHENIMKGAEVFAEKYKGALREVGDRLGCNSDLIYIATSAYNCGVEAAVRNYLNHNNPDLTTTNHNYAADAYGLRYPLFLSLLEKELTGHEF